MTFSSELHRSRKALILYLTVALALLITGCLCEEKSAKVQRGPIRTRPIDLNKVDRGASLYISVYRSILCVLDDEPGRSIHEKNARAKAKEFSELIHGAGEDEYRILAQKIKEIDFETVKRVEEQMPRIMAVYKTDKRFRRLYDDCIKYIGTQ